MAQTASVEGIRFLMRESQDRWLIYTALRLGMEPRALARCEPLAQLLDSMVHWAPLVLAVASCRALRARDREGALSFLRRSLGLRISGDFEYLEALWKIVEQERSWVRASLTPDGELPYLRTAVEREAGRIRRDREMSDRVWWRTNRGKLDDMQQEERGASRPEYLEDREDREALGGTVADPADSFERDERFRLITQALDKLEDQGGLPSGQAVIAQHWRSRRLSREAIKSGKATQSDYDSLVRKVRRRLELSA